MTTNEPVQKNDVRTWIAKLVIVAGLLMICAYGIHAATTHDKLGLIHAFSGIQLLLGLIIGYYFGKHE
jgi:hypothetical protein